MHDWITKMVPTSGEPLERGSLNLSVQELTLAHIPDRGSAQKTASRCLSSQSNTSYASKDASASGAGQDSCSSSSPNGVPWQRPEESIFRMHMHSSQGNSQCDSHSQCDVLVSHNGTHVSAQDADGHHHYHQMQVQGSAQSIGKLQPGAETDVDNASPASGNIVRGIKADSGNGPHWQVPVPVEPNRRMMLTGASSSPAEVALQYVQQQLDSKPSGSFQQGHDEFTMRASHAFFHSPDTSTITATGSVQPGVNQAGEHRSLLVRLLQLVSGVGLCDGVESASCQ